MSNTVAGIGPGRWSKHALAQSQERHALRLTQSQSTVYRLYTETFDNLPSLVARYFPGASLFEGVGLWEGQTERCTIIEIVASPDDLQKIVFLAGDIRVTNKQSGVLVTYQPLFSLMIDASSDARTEV